MASLQEYLEKMETGQLEALLAQEAYGRDHYPLSTIYLLCAILSDRDPSRGSTREVFLDFAARYAENKRLAEL